MPDWETWKRALAIALPLMLAESVDSILWIIDAYFVGGLGEKALAAVGVGGYLGWLMFVGGMMYYMGTLVLVAQATGRGDDETARRAAGEALTMNALLALPLLALGWHYSPGLVTILAGDRVDPVVHELAVEYFRARLLGLPFTYTGLVLGAVYRGVGKTRPVLYSTIVFAAVNAVLDPVLIYGLAGAPMLGIAGAGYASAIANAVYTAGLAIQSKKSIGYNVTPLPPGGLAVRATRIGLPALVERIAFVGGNLFYLGVVARCGDEALAAHTIGVRIESLAFLPLFSIGESAATLAGQELGAGNLERAKHSGLEVAKLNALAGLATAAILVAGSGWLPWAFTDSPQVAGLARTYLVIAALTEPLFGVAISLTMAIRGAGNTVIPTVINLASLYTLRVVPAGILPKLMPPGQCALGAWLAMAIDIAGRSAISTLVYKKYFERMARVVV